MTDLTFKFEGLRGVGHVKLSFTPEQRVYALFGINGVGKTKCLEALFQFYLFTSEPFMDDKQVRNVLTNDLLVAQKCETSDAITDSFKLQGKQYLSDHRSGQSPVRVPSSKRHALPVVFLGSGGRGHLDTGVLAQSQPVGTFDDRREHYFQQLAAGMRDDFCRLGMHESLEQWFVTLANSANPYQKGGDNRKVEIDTLLQLLHKIDSRYDETFMEIDGANRVSLKVDGVPTELRHLSTGFTSLVKILQAIISGYANFTNDVNLTRVKGYVFIDEIESHLHSQWQSKIVVLLKELFPNTTFFLATHSPIVLSQLMEGEAYLLERKADDAVWTVAIPSPNKRSFLDVLEDGTGVDLNALKRARMNPADQKDAKLKLLQLINKDASA